MMLRSSGVSLLIADMFLLMVRADALLPSACGLETL